MADTRVWSQPWSRWYLSCLVFLSLTSWTRALQITYCSPDRGDGNNYLQDTWMSNGQCSDNCMSSYAFAVILGKECWCSNYAPATSEDTSLCDNSCPGYPTEICGNTASGLYAYFQLSRSPSGTARGSSPSTTSSATQPVSTIIPSTTGSSQRASATWRASSLSVLVSILTSVVYSQSTAEPSTSSLSKSTIPEPTTSSSAPTSTREEPTQVYTSIISVTGQVSTIVVTPTPAQTSDSALGASNPATESGGISRGTVAGIVVGVAIGIGLLIGGLIFFWMRRRHRNSEAGSEGGSCTSPSHAIKSGGAIPSRQVSQMSSAGLLTRPARSNPGGFSSGEDPRTATDRSSTHMTVDQRLNPWAIYSNEESRASNVSLQDNQDYSRTLRVANPDP